MHELPCLLTNAYALHFEWRRYLTMCGHRQNAVGSQFENDLHCVAALRRTLPFILSVTWDQPGERQKTRKVLPYKRSRRSALSVKNNSALHKSDTKYREDTHCNCDIFSSLHHFLPPVEPGLTSTDGFFSIILYRVSAHQDLKTAP